MKYQELKEGIEHRLNSAAEDFFTIGYLFLFTKYSQL